MKIEKRSEYNEHQILQKLKWSIYLLLVLIGMALIFINYSYLSKIF